MQWPLKQYYILHHRNRKSTPGLLVAFVLELAHLHRHTASCRHCFGISKHRSTLVLFVAILLKSAHLHHHNVSCRHWPEVLKQRSAPGLLAATLLKFAHLFFYMSRNRTYESTLSAINIQEDDLGYNHAAGR